VVLYLDVLKLIRKYLITKEEAATADARIGVASRGEDE
jgi:hypothetical protein